MTADDLIQQVESLGGHFLIDGTRVRIQAPKGVITPELAARLRRYKQDIILQDSMRRLESAGICIAVWEDGSMRVLVTESDTLQTIDDGGCIYSPQDMWHYIQLEPHERRMLHQFKTRLGGTTEW